MRDWDVDNLGNAVQFCEVFGRENVEFAIEGENMFTFRLRLFSFYSIVILSG